MCSWKKQFRSNARKVKSCAMSAIITMQSQFSIERTFKKCLCLDSCFVEQKIYKLLSWFRLFTPKLNDLFFKVMSFVKMDGL